MLLINKTTSLPKAENLCSNSMPLFVDFIGLPNVIKPNSALIKEETSSNLFPFTIYPKWNPIFHPSKIIFNAFILFSVILPPRNSKRSSNLCVGFFRVARNNTEKKPLRDLIISLIWANKQFYLDYSRFLISWKVSY